jgi:hypothetical protein
MTLWGLLGQTGEGKTEWLAYLGFLLRQAGTLVHSNIHLNYKYEPINTIEELNDLPLEGNRVFLLDELWITGDSYEFTGLQSKRDVQLLTRFLLQARKADVDVVHTNQTFEQLAPRIRRNTSLLLRPRITLSFNMRSCEFTLDEPHPNKGIAPYVENIKFFDVYDRYLGFDVPFIVYPAHLYYDTRERVKPTPSVNTNRIMEQYRDFDGTKSELESALIEIEKFSQKEAKVKANFISAMQANPLLWKIYNEKNKR